MKELYLIRHAESAANRDGIWNGRSDGPLSAEGEVQLDALAARLADHRFSKVFSSPLERARLTAGSFSDEVEIEDDLVEIDLGEWDGLTTEEVRAGDDRLLREATTKRTVPMGRTGESIEEAGERVHNAIDKLVSDMADGSRIAVVTHGGLLQSVLHQYLPGSGRRVHSFVGNTAITKIVFYGDHSRLAGFNDSGHLGPRSHQIQAALSDGMPVISLIRHGQTKANVERRWQGQTDWDLDEVGYRQAEALGEFYGKWETVFSSPLQRARNTASFVARSTPEIVDGLMELHMGHWEGLTAEEIEEKWPGVLEEIYKKGVDKKRGEIGESWKELTTRFSGAVSGLTYADAEPTVVVAHGGAIRSYISSLTATSDTYAESLFTPTNTSVSHVALTSDGPLILDYAVAPHLESLDVT